MTPHSPENDRDVARSLGRLEGRVGGLEEKVSDLSERVDSIGDMLNSERTKLAKFSALLSAALSVAGFVALKALEILAERMG